jgi:hypothetical protein
MALPRVRQRGALFVDPHGAQLMLRGVNLGGDSKVPWPDGGTDHPSDFADHRTVSFVGRPFPLAEADEHLGRLAHWGFNTLRLLTTWEAVEHRGPGLYDEPYLEYLTEVCRCAERHGLYLFVDFHQDVWSRLTGGDGAPGWVFEAVGLDFARFAAADAAHIMQARYDYGSAERLQPSYPPMSWSSNYQLPANGIMWTLFWGGRLFTPQFKIDGQNVQDFLQGHYLGAMGEVARRLKDLPNVLGFDTLNEPGLGWLGEPMTYHHTAATATRPEPPRAGAAPSPLDCLAIASGVPATVPVLVRDRRGVAVPDGTVTLNAASIPIWNDGAACPFERAGAWELVNREPRARDENFFGKVGNRPLSISEDAFEPFFARVAATIREHQPAWSVFVELDPYAGSADRSFPASLPERSVNASHWYDLSLLHLKRFDPRDHFCVTTGERETCVEAIRARYVRELGATAAQASTFPDGAPTVIGEFGTPFDLDEGEPYRSWRAGRGEEAWNTHVEALALMYDAIDRLALHSTLWNYAASNRNDLTVGDRWNQEDLSIFSCDQQVTPADPDSGGRAVSGFCRPYARRVQGLLTHMRFEHMSARFVLRYNADAAIAGATEVYVPRLRYPRGFVVRAEGVPFALSRSVAAQTLRVRAYESGAVWLTVTPVGD